MTASPPRPVVRFEVRVDGAWHTIGTVSMKEPPGSVSSIEPVAGRQIYIFGWLPNTEGGLDGPGLWRSKEGIDEEIVGHPARLVTSIGVEVVAELGGGHPHEMMMIMHGRAIYARFRYGQQ